MDNHEDLSLAPQNLKVSSRFSKKSCLSWACGHPGLHKVSSRIIRDVIQRNPVSEKTKNNQANKQKTKPRVVQLFMGLK